MGGSFVEKIDVVTIRSILDETIQSIIAGLRVKLVVNGREYYDDDPAQAILIADIYVEVYDPTPQAAIHPINYICLEGTDTLLKDCASLALGTDIKYDDTYKQVTATKVITATSSYTAAAVQLGYYDPNTGFKAYFRTPITQTALSPGDALQITWTATISPSPSLSGILSGASYDDQINRRILRFLAGGRSSGELITAGSVVYIDQNGSTVLLNASLTRNRQNLVASHPATNFTSAGSLKYVRLVSTSGHILVIYTLPSAINVTTSDIISYSYQARWS